MLIFLSHWKSPCHRLLLQLMTDYFRARALRAEFAQNAAPMPGRMTRAAQDAQGVQQDTPCARGGEGEPQPAVIEPGVSRTITQRKKIDNSPRGRPPQRAPSGRVLCGPKGCCLVVCFHDLFSFHLYRRKSPAVITGEGRRTTWLEGRVIRVPESPLNTAAP
jgi:hypothetical protein